MGKENYQIRVEETRLLQCDVSLCNLTGPFYLIIPHPEKCGTGDASKVAGGKKLYFMLSV